MTTAPGHRILVVEDDPQDREDVVEILRSRGDDPRAVGTVEEALAALNEEVFCGHVLDQAVPLLGTAKAFLSGGERIVRAARALDKRRTDDGDHVTPIIAVTSHSEGSVFVTSLFEMGITTFVGKPILVNQRYFLDKVRGAFARAGREEHAKCAALVRGAGAVVVASAVGLAIDGKVTSAGRTVIEVNGEVRELQDSKFVVLLRAVAAHQDAPGRWSSGDALGLGTSRSAATYVRAALEGLVPAGVNPFEGDRRGNYRLNLAVVVARVDWDALALHPDAAVRRVAAERRKRRGGG